MTRFASLLLALSVVYPLALVGCSGGAGGGGDSRPPTAACTIGGRVTLNGAGFEGATVRLGEAPGQTATTDPSGAFTFAGLADGEYTVTAAVEGQQVSPSARAVTLSGISVSDADFALVTRELRGTVVQGGYAIAGARVTLRREGGPDRAATTNWGGEYAFAGLLNGIYRLEAVVDGQTFTPGFANPVTVADVDVAGLDFLVDTHGVTGRVAWAGADWAGGGLVILSGGVTRVADLDAAGGYSFQGVPNGSYTVKAYVSRQAVTPFSRDVVVAGGDEVVEAFALATHSLSGRVTTDGAAGEEGVEVTLAGPAARTVSTDAEGRFAFSDLPNGTYSVVPSIVGASCDPASRPNAVVFDGDSTGNDFTLTFALSAVATLGPGGVGATGATLRGAVNPLGRATTAWFEWATDPDFSFSSETAYVAVGEGTASVPLGVPLADLVPGTTYYVRAVGRSRAGTTRGSVQSFVTDAPELATVVVDSLEDAEWPPSGAVTLRSALEQVAPGGKITFDPALSGGTIALRVVGSAHSVLKGEAYEGMQFVGFAERDYGRSALYATKSVTIDASGLPGGITLRWAGSSPARVLAIYGDLTLKNVTITGGRSVAEAIEGGTQPHTLARGGGLAVWGIASLQDCVVGGNEVSGDLNASRDRGAFGGGLYANTVFLDHCVVSGNSATGYGAAGGGVYSVGGADTWQGSILTRSTISGNRVTGQHAYGGGVYSDGGGPGNWMTMELTNCTVARNLAQDHPDLPEIGQYYYRGGGVYMSNGYLRVGGCTIAENEVTGHPAVFSGKPNMGGGGIAATVGNAHVVEWMEFWHSIVAGNTVGGTSDDVFTGSLLQFFSYGYNLIGELDFTYMLVPAPAWQCLSRRHWPKIGDRDGIDASAVLSLADAVVDGSLRSVGTDAGQPAVLAYPPSGGAVDRIPREEYAVTYVLAGDDANVSYDESEGYRYLAEDFPTHFLEFLRTEYADVLGSAFGAGFGDLGGVTWYGPASEWPSNPDNARWIQFWRDVDGEIGDRLGAAGLGDDFWGAFRSSPAWDGIAVTVYPYESGPVVRLADGDQRGNARPFGWKGDIGAIEAEGH